MKLHVPMIPGESAENPALAFTALAWRFVSMMRARGHEVHTYEAEDCPRLEWDDAAGWNEVCVLQAQQMRTHGCIQPSDIICLPVGEAQRPLADGAPCHVVEHAVGYAGTCAAWRVFPSYAWMHTVVGAQQGAAAANGTWGDVVIPHPLDPAEHPLGSGEGGYLLYVGRLIERKGLDVAIRVAREVGLPLVAAGEGDYRPEGAEYIGAVNPTERAELMGDAVALLAPTLYVEPFGLVATEAQACGTPAITTDWGAFTETVADSFFRCLTLAEFTAAVGRAGEMDRVDRATIRSRALSRYSPDTIGPMYERFLSRVAEMEP